MSVYADSSLLMKLYVREPETAVALSVVSSAAAPLSFNALHRLEITSAMRRSVASRILRHRQAAAALRRLRADLKGGFYVQPEVPWAEIFARAHRLSQRHSRKTNARSLDLLHIAAALESGTSLFLTFDVRQKQVAHAEGLTVLP